MSDAKERPLQDELFMLADELRAMATLDGHFSRDPYQLEHADRMMSMAARLAALAEGTPPDHIERLFRAEPWFHASPAFGVEAATFDHEERLLLIQRKDNLLWALPGGFAEIGHTPTESALKELWEEAGVRGQAARLLGVFDGRYWETGARIHMVRLVFLVIGDDAPPVPGKECLAARYFHRDEIPHQLHLGQEMLVPKVFELAGSGETFFDPATTVGVDLPRYQRPEG